MELRCVVTTIIAAVATHLYTRHFEPENLLLYLMALLSAPVALVALWDEAQWHDIPRVYILFFTTLAISIAAYRLSPLHPLAKYPGPAFNKISQLWSVWIQITGRQHLVKKRLHDKYGDIVRIGPNELSVIDINVAMSTLGFGGLPKGRYYKARHDPDSPPTLLSLLDSHEHAERRRIWGRGFSAQALMEFHDPLFKRVDDLIEQLRRSPKNVNLSVWISLFALDFMGDMTFGEDLGMLQHGHTYRGNIHRMIVQFSKSLAVLSHTPWIMPIAKILPSLTRNVLQLREFSLECSNRRIKRGSHSKDIWYHLSNESEVEGAAPSELKKVIADSVLAIVAGSDTTSIAITNMLYLLATHRKSMHRLHREIDDIFPPGTAVNDISKLNRMPYLTACINETLRLLPPVLTNGPREVPLDTGGRVIMGHYFPPGTQIYVPPYAMHRNPKYFYPSPDEFIPERWIPAEVLPGRVHNLAAFIPFSYGPANCIGRGIARQEIMAVVGAVIQRFELRLVSEQDGGYERSLRDQLITLNGPLSVDLLPRM